MPGEHEHAGNERWVLTPFPPRALSTRCWMINWPPSYILGSLEGWGENATGAVFSPGILADVVTRRVSCRQHKQIHSSFDLLFILKLEEQEKTLKHGKLSWNTTSEICMSINNTWLKCARRQKKIDDSEHEDERELWFTATGRNNNYTDDGSCTHTLIQREKP